MSFSYGPGYTGLSPFVVQQGVFNQQESVLAGMTTAQLQVALTSAQTAYAALMAGGQVVQASYGQGDGTRAVTYKSAEAPQLLNWITILQRALGLGGNSRRPMRAYFR